MEGHVLAVLWQAIQPFDHRAFFIRPRITIRRHDHGHRVIVGPVDLRLIQRAFRRRQHQVERLRAQTHHQHLTFRVPKAAVIFHEARLSVFDHKARVEHALVGHAAFGHFRHGWFDDLVHGLLDHAVCHHRSRGIGAHAARIEACIAVTHAFVILRCAHGQDVLAITEDKPRGLFALHEFLNHDLRARAAKGAAKHVVNRVQCRLLVHGDDHTFARGKPVGFDHNRRALVADIGFGGFCGIKPGIACCWRARGVANFFGKALGGFELCRRFRRAKGQHTCGAQLICDTCGQRRLRANDHEINRVFFDETHHRRAIVDVKAGAFGNRCDTRVAGRDDQLVAFRVLQGRPCQRMLTATAAQNQNIHGSKPLLHLRSRAF